jgi:oligopeptide/dipeptide ABC transporter ATP-binding protein
MSDPPLLQIRALSISYPGDRGPIHAVRELDLDLTPGECLGVVGESGSGKTQLLLSVLGLAGPNARISGSIRYRGRELIGQSAAALNQVRGARISMVFQDPMTALNPYLQIGVQIAEVLRQHRSTDEAAAGRRAIELLESLHVPQAAARMKQYPHELSGGMRQRVMIAMALIAEPEIVLADEPSAALDVTIQAQLLAVLREVRARTGTSIVLVTHDLGVTAELADRVAVMYAGRVVEQAPVGELFAHPRHPYTQALQNSIPRLDVPRAERLPSISGAPPDAFSRPPGCPFAPRCPYTEEICRRSEPPLTEVAPGHWKSCYHGGAA